MINAELRFLETVPMYLKEIAKALNKLVELLSEETKNK